MTDGSLPPAVAPFPVTAPHRVVPAPRPVDGSPRVELDDAWPAALVRRLERLHADRDGVLVRAVDVAPSTGGLGQALVAAWGLLPGGQGALPRLGITVAGVEQAGPVDVDGVDVDGVRPVRVGDTVCEDATALLLDLSGLDLLVVGWLLACSDDLVVLHRTGDGTLRAELLAVAFPSGWPPRLRAGASLLELHAPIADGERLQRAAPALSEALLTKGPLRQHVWGLDPDGRLDRDPSAPDAPTGQVPADPGAWFLRVERQTSVPLPHLGRALFTIRPHLTPLPDLTPPQREVLADAVASMGAGARAYKGITDVADDLLAWLRTP